MYALKTFLSHQFGNFKSMSTLRSRLSNTHALLSFASKQLFSRNWVIRDDEGITNQSHWDAICRRSWCMEVYHKVKCRHSTVTRLWMFKCKVIWVVALHSLPVAFNQTPGKVKEYAMEPLSGHPVFLRPVMWTVMLHQLPFQLMFWIYLFYGNRIHVKFSFGTPGRLLLR